MKCVANHAPPPSLSLPASSHFTSLATPTVSICMKGSRAWVLLPNLICKVEKEKKNIAQRKKEAEQEEEVEGKGSPKTTNRSIIMLWNTYIENDINQQLRNNKYVANMREIQLSCVLWAEKMKRKHERKQGGKSRRCYTLWAVNKY